MKFSWTPLLLIKPAENLLILSPAAPLTRPDPLYTAEPFPYHQISRNWSTQQMQLMNPLPSMIFRSSLFRYRKTKCNSNHNQRGISDRWVNQYKQKHNSGRYRFWPDGPY